MKCIHSRLFPFLFLPFFISIASTGVAGATESSSAALQTVWDSGVAAQLAHSPEAKQQLHQMLLLAETPTLSADSLLDALETLQADNSLPLPARERVLYDLAVALRTSPPSDASRQAMMFLSQHQSQTYIPHQESRGRINLPLYPVAAAARGTLTVWARQAAAERASANLQRDPAAVLSAYIQASDESHSAGLLDALESASLNDLAAFRVAVLSELPTTPAVAPVAAVLVKRLGDEVLCDAVIESGDSLTARRLLEQVPEIFAPTQAFAVLQRASTMKPLASVAIMEIGRLLPTVPAATGFLLDTLTDPSRGGSAAMALANVEDTAVIQSMAKRLANSQDKQVQSNVALALMLNSSFEAQLALKHFAGNPTAPEQLREEVVKWLEN